MNKENLYYVEDFGAKADQKTINTAFIQAAIDKANLTKGTVILNKGTYLTGTIKLKSNVTLQIEKNSTLLGSPKCEDYEEVESKFFTEHSLLPRSSSKCLVFADSVDNICITGGGNIDGNGTYFVAEKSDEEFNSKPRWRYKRIYKDSPARVLFIFNSNNVKINNINIVNLPSGWATWFNCCSNIEIEECNVMSNMNYENNDGLHFNSCSNVSLKKCNLVCGDDCIIVRANNIAHKTKHYLSENVLVSDCVLQSWSSAIRIGWVKDGEVKNCVFKNILIKNSFNGLTMDFPGKWKYAPRSTDDGNEENYIHDITYENIKMEKLTNRPIFIHATDMPHSFVKEITNITYKNIKASAYNAPYIFGNKEKCLKTITFKDCEFTILPKKDMPFKFYKRISSPKFKDIENLKLDNFIFKKQK